MNRQEWRECVRGFKKHKGVIEAFIEGADVEYRPSSDDGWEDCFDGAEFYEYFEYRVKQEEVGIENDLIDDIVETMKTLPMPTYMKLLKKIDELNEVMKNG